MTAEYGHGVEEEGEWFFSDRNQFGRQARIPLMAHADKMRLLEVNCPREALLSGVRGPDARVHCSRRSAATISRPANSGPNTSRRPIWARR
jgi:hypothetical protein